MHGLNILEGVPGDGDRSGSNVTTSMTRANLGVYKTIPAWPEILLSKFGCQAGFFAVQFRLWVERRRAACPLPI